MKPITEAAFQAQVLQLAKIHGWRSAHFRPAQTARGWRTAVSGDGAGFPDLILVRGYRLIVAELKRDAKQKPRPEQTAWLDAFRGVGAEVFLWTPGDWVEIERVLQ